MDQMMVDVSDIPGVRVLDQVTLIGRDKDQCISFEELGELSGKFNYEFACGLGNRIPRLYYRNGRLVEKKQFF
jgi:alanine racemase